jgi:hypothetical protein
MAKRDETENREVSIKTIPFLGLDEDWREWHMKVKAVAKKRGWHSALINNLSNVPDTEDAEQRTPRTKANDDAYLWLVLSTSKRAFLHVDSSQENAFVAWNNLLDRYKASDMMDLLSLLQDFTKCVMDGATDQPCFWFMELDHISEKISQAGGNRKSDSEKIAHDISEAPREYLPVTDRIATMLGLRQMIPVQRSQLQTLEKKKTQTLSPRRMLRQGWSQTGPGRTFEKRSRISGRCDSGSQTMREMGPRWLSMRVLRPIAQKRQDGRNHRPRRTHGRSSKAPAIPAASKVIKRWIVEEDKSRRPLVLQTWALQR